MKRIPSTFQMGPHTVTVRVISRREMGTLAAKWSMGEVDGLCDYEHHTIYLRKADKGFPKRLQMHTFWHEYFHMLFHCLGRERLARDETLVDNCGALHLQALNTAT